MVEPRPVQVLFDRVSKAIEAFLSAQGLAPSSPATVDLFEGVAEGPTVPPQPATAKRERSGKKRASGR